MEDHPGNTVSCPYTGFDMNELYFISKDTGFVETNDGYVLQTTNGALTWNQITTPSFVLQYNGISDFHFVNKSVGYACYTKESIDKTTNGGTTWTNIYSENEPDHHPLHAIWATSAGIVFAAGDSHFMISRDAGASWEVLFQQDGTSINEQIEDIYFFDGYNGFGVTFEGNIYKFQCVDPPQN